MINFKETYEKIMNTKGLVIILIIGVLFLILPDSSTPNKKSKENISADYGINLAKYEKDLENKLSDILSTINGVEKVSVMITFSDCGRLVYSQEEQSERSEKTIKGNQKPVLKNSTQGEEPILVKSELPKISGVLITAEGAESPTIRENITDAIKAVLDVSTKNISVLSR